MKFLNTSTILTLLVLGAGQLTAEPLTADIKAPQALEIVAPEVPVNYIRWGVPGHVVVDFQINEDGQPENIHVVESDDRQYASNVKDAVRKWRFEKPEVAGITYRLPVNFSHKREGPR
jgi:TonB family protein